MSYPHRKEIIVPVTKISPDAKKRFQKYFGNIPDYTTNHQGGPGQPQTQDANHFELSMNFPLTELKDGNSLSSIKINRKAVAIINRHVDKKL